MQNPKPILEEYIYIHSSEIGLGGGNYCQIIIFIIVFVCFYNYWLLDMSNFVSCSINLSKKSSTVGPVKVVLEKGNKKIRRRLSVDLVLYRFHCMQFVQYWLTTTTTITTTTITTTTTTTSTTTTTAITFLFIFLYTIL